MLNIPNKVEVSLLIFMKNEKTNTDMYSVNNNLLRIKLVAIGNSEALNAKSSARGLKIPKFEFLSKQQ